MTALAAVAQRELEVRLRQPDWPAADIAAWRDIVALLDDSVDHCLLDWPAMLRAADAAEDRRIAALIEARAKADARLPAIEQRLVEVANVRRVVEISAARRGFLLLTPPVDRPEAA